jgi:hypothetical protein
MSRFGRFDTVKKAILFRVIYTRPVKIPVCFLAENNNTDQKICMEMQGTQNSKSKLEKEQVGRLELPVLKVSNQVGVVLA